MMKNSFSDMRNYFSSVFFIEIKYIKRSQKIILLGKRFIKTHPPYLFSISPESIYK